MSRTDEEWAKDAAWSFLDLELGIKIKLGYRKLHDSLVRYLLLAIEHGREQEREQVIKPPQ